MRSAVYLLVIIQAVSGTAAQGSSCHYKNGCSPPTDVCSVPPPACQTDWSGRYCQMHNIARGKPANQSSTWTDGTGTGTYDAGKAVDGNVSTGFFHGSCSHTDEQGAGNASWHVLLGGTFLISRITIYLRSDAIDHYQAMEVLVNNRTCRKLPVTDIRDSPAHLRSNPVTLSCIQPIEGDTVTIEMAGPYLALCEVQVFGEKKVPCHCSNGCSDFPNTPCSATSTGPVCIPSWFGRFCQMENIAFQKTAAQSSNYSEGGIPYCAAYAVDWNTDTDFPHRSCSHTNNASASWQVLLDDHRMFNISRIRIYLRDGFWDRNDGLQVLVNGDLCVPVSGTPDWLDGAVTNPFDVTCTHVMKGNNVTITISGAFLSLCEVQVFICGDGWFGGNCEKQCQCLDPSEVCDKETGYCRSGCAAVKHGPGCQQVCSDGWFGSDCNKLCQCLDPSEVCDKETGYCRSGCAAGKHGPGCQQDCDHGHYGVNCSYTCGQCTGSSDCQEVDGTCTQGCQRGYSPPLCKVCNDQWFGTNCSEQCKCQNETEACDKTTGNCTSGCRAGKTGVGCQDDCVEGRYGVNCSQRCGSCKDDSPCNTITGVCAQGCEDNFQTPYCKLCNDGWFGTNCSEQCKCQNETEVCDKTTGYCTSGCRAGKTGVGCQDGTARVQSKMMIQAMQQ
ncbi:multiple epidermal growth factor-like domains protein 6, partial [Haliotis rubra]|uniref:multiple epidermal growth factor-like domains protein 6 n=1 Tax=Haliotis rubra TaxID=36100 RepID=UPI001EE4F54F